LELPFRALFASLATAYFSSIFYSLGKYHGAKVPGSVSLPGANGLGSGNSSSQFLCGLYFDIDIERVPIVRIQTEFLTVFRT